MNPTSLPLGATVRFRGRFELDDKQVPIENVIVTITEPTGSTVYMLGTGVVRDGVGAFHVEHRVNQIGAVSVRFASEASWAECEYSVEPRMRADAVQLRATEVFKQEALDGFEPAPLRPPGWRGFDD